MTITNKDSCYPPFGAVAQCSATLTLPDGSTQIVHGSCISGIAYAVPNDGSCTWVGTHVGNGVYSVVIYSSSLGGANNDTFAPGALKGTQNMGNITITYRPNGYLTLGKDTTDTRTNGNPNYSLGGASYTVYDSDWNYAGTLTTDESGYANTLDLIAGTYYVQESTASWNFDVNTETNEVYVVAGETAWVTSPGSSWCNENPKRGSIKVIKKSADDRTAGNNNYTFEGIVYTITDKRTGESLDVTLNANGEGQIDGLIFDEYESKEKSTNDYVDRRHHENDSNVLVR